MFPQEPPKIVLWTTRTKEIDAVLAPPPYFADGNLRPRERQSLP